MSAAGSSTVSVSALNERIVVLSCTSLAFLCPHILQNVTFVNCLSAAVNLRSFHLCLVT